MRLAEKLGQDIPKVASVKLENDYITEKLDMLIQWMTKYNPKDRINFRRIYQEMKAILSRSMVINRTFLGCI